MSAAEWIIQRRDLLDAATDGPWVREWSTSDQWWTIHGQPNPAKGDGRMVCPEVAMLNHREDWTADVDLIADARTSLPAALDALVAVLGLHQASPAPRSWGVGAEVCGGCGGDEFVPHPCPTVAAIEAALRGDS